MCRGEKNDLEKQNNHLKTVTAWFSATETWTPPLYNKKKKLQRLQLYQIKMNDFCHYTEVSLTQSQLERPLEEII